MSLRYLVPSLGLLACTAGFATAADVGGLSINGYVDSTLAIESLGDDLVGKTRTAPGATTYRPATNASRTGLDKTGKDASNTVIDFANNAEIALGYKLGDVKARVELYYTDAGDTVLENAYVDWAVSKDLVNIKMGRMDTPLGLEALDSPELYRVNFSNMLASGILGGTGTASSMFIDGVMVSFKAGQISGGVAIADGVYDPKVPKDNASLALLGTVKFTQEKVVSVKGTLVYDMDAGKDAGTATATAKEDDAFGIDLVATSDIVKDLIFGGELTYVSMGEPSAMGILAMANYKLPTGIPMSVTGMIDYVTFDAGKPKFDLTDLDRSELEIAVALLANPTKEDNFATNLEIRYIQRDIEDQQTPKTKYNDSDEFGIYFEMVAVIP